MSKVQDAPAAPSTATVTETEPVADNFRERFDASTPEQRAKWSLSGNDSDLAESPSPKKEETPAATPKEEAPKPGSEAGQDKDRQEPKRDRSVARKDRKIGELSAENRRLQRDLEEARKAQSSSNAAPAKTTETPNDGRPQRPEEPEITDFHNINDYNQARKEYRAKLDQYEDARDEWNRKHWEGRQQQAVTQSETEKQHKATIEGFDKRASDFEKAQGDWDEKQKLSPGYRQAFQELLDTFGEVHPDPLIVTAIMESEQSAALVHHLGTHPDELDRILELSTSRAIAELGKLELEATKTPKPITQTKAPAPGTRVHAHTQATGDPIEDAYARGDFALGAKLEAERDAKARRR